MYTHRYVLLLCSQSLSTTGAFDDDPFVIGEYDGIIRTNVYFQEDQEGYIEFVVKVNDSLPQHFDKANVSVRPGVARRHSASLGVAQCFNGCKICTDIKM